MNIKIIQRFFKEVFIIDGYTKEDMEDQKLYVEHLENICNNHTSLFLEYCHEELKYNCFQNEIKNIRKEMIQNDFLCSEDDMDDIDYICKWYLNDYVFSKLQHTPSFFINILDEINS